ncbi:397_t:CDS:10 [Ambispora leptoticha]|uniref:Glycogen debranching enzyme n=1 Tax=Ambispora leptoticha TaxID=144679 RepID=A0A9N8YXH6_9GLOM|nr:397_t:CDS:10 [Ambispora leptoticha]
MAINRKEKQLIVYRLELEAEGSLPKDKQYIRLPPPIIPYVLRFNIRAGSPASHGGVLYTNYPISGGEFDRNKYYSKNFPTDFSRSLNIDIVIRMSGAFDFYVEHRAVSTLPGEVLTSIERTEIFHFNVDPLLHILPRRRILSSKRVSSLKRVPLPLDSLVIETVLPKLLGPLNKWDQHIKAISELGYNMIHYVPIQARGISNSPYSLYDQLAFSDDLFDGTGRKKSMNEKIDILRNTLKKFEDDYGILSLTDVVWNHTSCNSKWLEEHPESGYNLHNSPHLNPAYELDTALLQLSRDLAKHDLPTLLHSENDLNRILDYIKSHLLPEIRLWEYYIIDVKDSVDNLRTALEAKLDGDHEIFKDIDIGNLSLQQQADLFLKYAISGQDKFGTRFVKKICVKKAIGFLKKWSEGSEFQTAYKTEQDRIYSELQAGWQERENVRLAKIEKRRLERERISNLESEKERIERERLERVRLEKERIERAKLEKARIKQALKKVGRQFEHKAEISVETQISTDTSNENKEEKISSNSIQNGKGTDKDILNEEEKVTVKKSQEGAEVSVASTGKIRIDASDAVENTSVTVEVAKEESPKNPEENEKSEKEPTKSDEPPVQVPTVDPKEFYLKKTEKEPIEPDEPQEPPVQVPTVDPKEFYLKKIEQLLNEINLRFYRLYDDDVLVIIENLFNRIKYMRLDGHGPKMGEITKNSPLIETYFTRLPLNETTRKHPEGSLAVANNGWIWNANPLQDFASSESYAYLKREVIVWGDCVKLRYGKSREENPWLWDHMTKYTELSASLFHGFRIDNCHSTPIHLAKYLLDKARRIKPNLYVVAELFTGSEEMDIQFVSQLGINSLIREAMQPWDTKELSRYVHRHGGKPIGSIDTACLSDSSTCIVSDEQKETCLVIPVYGSKPHALFMDCTHDNETPHQKRTAEDTLSTGALASMSSCAVGSTKGYDEIFPYYVDLVNETRLYPFYEEPLDIVKKVLQHLHTEMALDGYIETHVHHENDYIIVHRFHPDTLNGYLLVAHSAFTGFTMDRGDLNPINLRGTSAELLFSTYLEVKSRSVENNEKFLSGLPATLKSLNAPILRRRSDTNGEFTEVILPKEFPSGSVMLLKTWVDNKPEGLDDFVETGTEEAFEELDLVDLNIVLYRCDGEENDVTPGNGVYHIPNYGDIPYCGIEGFMSVLRPIMKHNDLGHPFCVNLREGHWALDYTVGRLERHLFIAPKLKKLVDWYHSRFTAIKAVPNFLVPKYFALTMKTAHKAATYRAFQQLSPFVLDGGSFIHSLALCSVQMYGTVLSTGLHPTKNGPSCAAGLPHFVHHHMRCWGRDVFISLRGLFITTGNFQAAREHIVGFGSVLKHGMIPNLLDAGRRPRYNCRDATWWYLQAIQEYCKFAPEGYDILKESIARRFPKDDEFIEADDPKAYSYKSTLLEIIQEIMERHARGIHFREWNAGPNLDHAMKSEGFQVDVEVDWDTGLLLGGNKWNCGTWMDKMGDSAKAGNLGEPATPRDGADVEIIGLLKSTLRWLIELNEKGVYPWKGVEIQDKSLKNEGTKLITFAQWNDLIQKSFEKNFYIPIDPSEDSKYNLKSYLVKRRGIYKDTHKSSNNYTDYQLRPNFPIAMVVAPELFNEEHALKALNVAREIITGPLGMRTLDPDDPAYRGNYDNSNDGTDKSVAKGWNYHQGPEWLWVTGYFLRAYLHFDIRPHETIHTIMRILLPHRKIIETSVWAGLPELTNANGAECHDACPTQAWSAATLLDLFDDIKKIKNVEVNFDE